MIKLSCILVSLLIIFTVGCIENIDEPMIETFTISGFNQIRTIHYTKAPVELIISGEKHLITVTPETDLISLIISGFNSVVRISKNHSINPIISGENNFVEYYD